MIGVSEKNGKSVAGYELGREIGRGGFGVVYEALGPSGTVAVKMLRPTPFVSGEYIEKIIKNTVEISSKCASLNVVGLLDHGCVGGEYYMVSKYYPKGSLEKLLDSGCGDIREKIRLLVSMADTLHQVHRRGIVHGDIKPANFLMSDGNVPMLSDFYFDLNRGTTAGLPKGTIEFMSPEQAQGRLFSYHSDIYSLGVLAYFMFTGLSPFHATKGIRALVSEKIKGVFPEPFSLDNKIGKGLNDVILKAMRSEPRERFSNMDEFSKALLSIGL